MNKSPIVSIIIITYNDQKYLVEAIESAFNQTYSNCEIIVVDDGSTDDTRNIIESKYSKRLKYYWKENGGQGSARSLGIDMSNGEYIQFLDSDDILLPTKIEHQLTCLEANSKLAFVYGRTLCFHGENIEKTWDHPCNSRAISGNLFESILSNGNFVNIAQPLTRRSWINRIGGWDSTIRDGDDYDLSIRLAYCGAICKFIDEPVFLYRQHLSQNSFNQFGARHTSIGQVRGEIYLLEKLCNKMKQDCHPQIKLVEKKIGALMFNFGLSSFFSKKRKAGLNYMIKAIKLNREKLTYKISIISIVLIFPYLPYRKIKNIFFKNR